jgi:hypothetical protein
MNFLMNPHNIIVCNRWYTCLHYTYAPRPPKEPTKIDTRTYRDIANNNVISFVIRKNIVNSSTPRWQDINNGENNVNFPIVGVLLFYFEHGRSLHLLATTNCRPKTCIGWLHMALTTHNMHMGIAWTKRLGTK